MSVCAFGGVVVAGVLIGGAQREAEGEQRGQDGGGEE